MKDGGLVKDRYEVPSVLELGVGLLGCALCRDRGKIGGTLYHGAWYGTDRWLVSWGPPMTKP